MNLLEVASPTNIMQVFELSKLIAIGLGTNELLIIVGIIVLLFGGTQIPRLMKGLGQGMGEFQKGLHEGKKKDE